MDVRFLIGISTVFLFIGSSALDYTILESLEMACHPRDRCMFARWTSFSNRSCECDDLCHTFQDCCIDEANLVPLLPSLRPRKFPCMTFGGQSKVGVYAVNTCPHGYRASNSIRSLCQEDDFADPLVSAPVTVVSTGKTYSNRYCAECNGASPSSFVSWLIYVHCESLIPLLINDTFIWQNLKYNNSQRGWGVQLDDVFHKCELIFDKPSYLNGVRYCRADTIDSCLPSLRGASVKRLCESYSAVVYDTENAYKNPHCALCNNKTTNVLTCLDSSLFIRKANKPFSFALLLDVNRRDGDEVGVVQRCPAGEKYDPFFKKCRKLVCALPGYKMVKGKCKKD